MKTKLVRDWMTSSPFTVLPDTGLTEAYNLMTQQRIRRLPVVAQSKLVGIVTLGDLREAGAAIHDGEAQKKRVDVAMHENPFTVSPEATLSEAAKIMLQHKISGLPVVEGDRLVGIITESDIFRAVMGDERAGEQDDFAADLGESVVD
jgi:acetoin utilization protein AcuB